MKIASNKIKDIARFFREELADVYESGEMETIMRYCFEDFLNIPSFNFDEQKENTVSESDLLKFNFAIKDLKKQKPLQYVLGKADFYGLKFMVNETVLIPRPETEELVDLILKDLNGKSATILDIGTGSGCIAVTLKKNSPSSGIMATDISEKAIRLAKSNAVFNGVELDFIEDDILHSKIQDQKPFDIIVSNPPYIKASESAAMAKNVLEYEPHLALFVEDEDALLFYRSIADFALKNLKPGGKLYFEINGLLGTETRQLIESKGFKNVALIKDMSNKNRILRGTL